MCANPSASIFSDFYEVGLSSTLSSRRNNDKKSTTRQGNGFLIPLFSLFVSAPKWSDEDSFLDLFRFVRSFVHLSVSHLHCDNSRGRVSGFCVGIEMCWNSRWMRLAANALCTDRTIYKIRPAKCRGSAGCCYSAYAWISLLHITHTVHWKSAR